MLRITHPRHEKEFEPDHSQPLRTNILRAIVYALDYDREIRFKWKNSLSITVRKKDISTAVERDYNRREQQYLQNLVTQSVP